MFTQLPIKRASLTLLAVAAGALPAGAAARPFFDPPNVGQTSHPYQPAPAVQHPAASASAGFQWDDAGIGAASAIVLLSGGAGAATVIRRRRRHRVATA